MKSTRKAGISHVLLLILVLAGCEKEDQCLEGQGPLQTYPLHLPAFDRICLEDDIEIQVRQDSPQSVTLATQPGIFEVLEYGVRDGFLEVGYGDVNCIRTPYGIWLSVQAPDLEEIRISGETELVVFDETSLVLDRLMIDVSGVAKVTLEGAIDEQVLDISGTAEVRNFDCRSERVSVMVSGRADLEVHATDLLDIEVSGEAVIRYRGNPVIRREITGTLELIDAN